MFVLLLVSLLLSPVFVIHSLHRHHTKEHLLELVTPTRTFFIQADNQSDMDEWIKAFQRAIGSLRSSSTVCQAK